MFIPLNSSSAVVPRWNVIPYNLAPIHPSWLSWLGLCFSHSMHLQCNGYLSLRLTFLHCVPREIDSGWMNGHTIHLYYNNSNKSINTGAHHGLCVVCDKRYQPTYRIQISTQSETLEKCTTEIDNNWIIEWNMFSKYGKVQENRINKIKWARVQTTMLQFTPPNRWSQVIVAIESCSKARLLWIRSLEVPCTFNQLHLWLMCLHDNTNYRNNDTRRGGKCEFNFGTQC